MALTDLQKVRSLIGDMNKSAVRETVTENADGSSNTFKLDMFPIRTGTLVVEVSGASIGSATANFPEGVLDFTGTNTPTANAQVVASYSYNALSDDEIQAALDIASGDGIYRAAAIACRALAGNFARFFAYTQGSKKVDKRLMSDHFRRLADSMDKSADKMIESSSMTLTVSSFDDSGTVYENYDTAIASLVTSTAC